MKISVNLIFILAFLLFACRRQPAQPPLFQMMDNTGIDFANNIHNTKDFNIFSYRNFYNGGGVAIGDINNDGLPDIFFTANMGSNKLYLNKGNFQFEDITEKAGFTNKGKWGTGVVFVDINSDGWLDIYVCNAGYQKGIGNENELYINNHNLTFIEKAKEYGLNESGYTTHAAFFDYDLDGDLDCYILKNSFIPVNTLNYANKRELRAEDWPVADFLKGGGDKLLRNNSLRPPLTPPKGENPTHRTLRPPPNPLPRRNANARTPLNEDAANKMEISKSWPLSASQAPSLGGGGGEAGRVGAVFSDVSQSAGIYGSLIGFGLGVTVGDVNGDNYPDIYISNDFFERDYLYLNQKDGTFKEDLESCMQHTSHSSMGADIGDVNNDGYPDIFTTDMLPDDDYRLRTTATFDNYDVNQLKVNSGFYNQFMQNTLQVNNKAGKFLETGFYSGVAASDWSWGGLIFDADNDGLSDIFVCNGIYHDVTDQDFIDFFANDVIQRMAITGRKDEMEDIISKMPSHPIPNKAFKNKGNLQFADEGAVWGLTQTSFSNGAAYADLDNDGDLDLVVNNVNQKAFVYKNMSREQNANSYIGFLLKGKSGNTFAIGSTIKVYAGDQILSREIMPSRGFQSSVDYKTIIGLGKMTKVDSVVIIWPDRSFSKIIDPQINKVNEIKEPADEKYGLIKDDGVIRKTALFDSIPNTFEKHNEDQYVDFYYERNIPEMLSREGPKAAVGDVNGDGFEDVYICGAAGQAGQLYLQTAKGFEKKKVSVFEQHAIFEDVAALFFDADGDGDLDLFVGSGGNNYPVRSQQYQDRLYINDGKGNFVINANALPFGGMNTSVALAIDFDKDGDLDLFVGSRSVPQNYGISPVSHLYLNNGQGIFSDVSKTTGAACANVGMVTGAVWVDVTGDKKEDLVVVGEWMAPHVFSFQGNQFQEVKTNLSNLHGWWQTVAAADLDGDGDKDLILGNVGENFYLKPDSVHPVKLWMRDFDANGTMEKIITRTVNEKDMPVFMKRDITDQVASLRKQNLTHAEFAKKSIEELFGEDAVAQSILKQFNYASSIIAYNEGGGKFTIQKLPLAVQLSCVSAIKVSDINNDGKPDLLLGGNKFCLLPQFSRIDASYGQVLLNTGNSAFQCMGTNESGVEIRGEVKDIVQIKGQNKNYWLWLQNNERPVLFGLNHDLGGLKDY